MLPSEIIRNVCQNAIPPVSEVEIMAENTQKDTWNASRLKSIIASQMLQIGMTKTEIATYLGQSWNATASQIKNAPKLKTHPRYKHHFKS
jgi:hypothetical protein